MKKTISKLKKELDKWFSLYIRLRDANEYGMVQCFTSGRVVQRLQERNSRTVTSNVKKTPMATRWCDTENVSGSHVSGSVIYLVKENSISLDFTFRW